MARQGLFQLVTRVRKEYQAGHFYATDQGQGEAGHLGKLGICHPSESMSMVV